MKKQLLLFSALIVLALFSCRKSDIDAIQTVSLSVQIGYSANDSALGLSKSDIPVKITNLVNGQENTAKTNANGIAEFPSITPGNYTILVTRNYTAEEFYAATNVFVTTDVAYNATEIQPVNQNSNIKLTLQSGKIGDLVFKQLYYTGSNTKTGAMFRDQFIEIYNNSNQTIYLDSLYFGSTESTHGKFSEGGAINDWATAIVEKGTGGIGDLNKDFLYFPSLFMISGGGKDHPLEPGKTFLIAQNALNHTQSFEDNGGKLISVIDPSLTVNLSAADLEINLVEYKRALYTGSGTFRPFGSDVDNPLIPNATVIIAAGNDWVMDSKGREDFVMFKLNGLSATGLPVYKLPGNGTKSSIQVPLALSNIIDAVEIMPVIESEKRPKRLPVALDASATAAVGGEYSSQSVIRKTVKTVDGRRILQDTNNSANDFETKTKADPSKSDASFEK